MSTFQMTFESRLLHLQHFFPPSFLSSLPLIGVKSLLRKMSDFLAFTHTPIKGGAQAVVLKGAAFILSSHHAM